MIYCNMSLWIAGTFLLLTLIVGVYFSRKKTTFREYAVGNKQFATATLVATVLATDYGGGGLLRNVECVYEHGVWWIVFSCLATFGYWIFSRLAIRMGPFMHHLSMAETMGYSYGKYARVVTALVGICKSIVIITMQITAMSRAIAMCLSSVNPSIATILTTLLLIFYSTFGGIRSVTFTDVLQFLTFSIIIPLLVWFMFIKSGKPITAIAPVLQSDARFQFSSLCHFNTPLVGMGLLLLSNLVSINPMLIQRVYMASGPMQAQKIFSYGLLFSLIISSLIILVGLFAFVEAPGLPKTEIWEHIVGHVPVVFQGFLSIALLAMAMSTADSSLNICAVMVVHDVLQSNKKDISDASQLKIARWTTLLLGLLAMLLAFQCKDLLKLLHWSLACSVPITTAPFILAVFGFRGTARTALMGMATGVVAILSWNKWVEPVTGMNGAFVAMLANGFAMMAAHYLLKQPASTGWVHPDNDFSQMQQEHARKRMERREAIKNSWANRKTTLAKLLPSHTLMVYMGLYFAITSLLAYSITRVTHHGCWLVFQLFGAACCLGYPFIYDISKKIRAIPYWLLGLCWFIVLAVYLPLNLLWDWWHVVDPIFTASLSLTHYSVILWVLPLYLGIRVVGAVSLLSIYPIVIGLPFATLCSLLPLFLASLLILAIIIWFKTKHNSYITQILYLKNQETIRRSRKLKASLYDSAMVPSTARGKTKGYGAILTQVVGKIEESISFLDGNMPLYKQDFQTIINKLYDWVAYFNKREKAKKHALLQPAKITLEKLVRKVEVALSQEGPDPPRLLVETISDPNGALASYIVCDIYQVVYLLVQAMLRVGKPAGSVAPLIKIQLHPTALQFKQVDPIERSDPSYRLFQATALVIGQATADLPKVRACYDDRIDLIGPKGKQETPPSIDLQEATISTIVSAHYGYLEYGAHAQQSAILLVLPNDVTDILSNITTTLPLDSLTSEASVTPKEQADSMMALMQFHDYVCKSAYNMDPVDVGTISGLLLLLRQHFGFKRHASGQLFYVRAVGIAELVVAWAFHSPKVIYATLLYELVRRTCLPLSYVKEHYNLGVYAFVLNVVGIDKRQSLDHPSLFYVQNRLKEAIKQDHVQLSVLFIKLAERLYDLRHASGYSHLSEVTHMAQETLAIDIQIANTYLGSEIGAALEQAAKKALEICKDKNKHIYDSSS